MANATCIIAAIFALQSTAGTGEPGGVVWDLRGVWTDPSGKNLGTFGKVHDVSKLKLASGSGEITVLFARSSGGYYANKVCTAPGNCNVRESYFSKTESSHQAKQAKPDQKGESSAPKDSSVVSTISTWLTTAIATLGSKPHMALPMSRATGWKDAIIAVPQNGPVDLADVFSAARPRQIAFKLCLIDGSPCHTTLKVNWDGKSAPLNLAGLHMSTYRLIAENGANEAWVRFVTPAQLEPVNREYQRALSVLRTWSWPEDMNHLPGFGRLERLALTEAGRE